MPEGPEIKVLANYLNSNFLNKTISKIDFFECKNDKYRSFVHDFTCFNSPLYINSVSSKGKLLYFDCIITTSNQKIYILNHLGLSGKWSNEKSNSSRIKITIGDTELFYNDVLQLGNFYFLVESKFNEELYKLGPDVLSESFTLSEFEKRIYKYKNKCISALLIEQSFISGIGNYLRADILYLAKIHPLLKVNQLNSENIKTLYESIVDVTTKSFQSNGQNDYSNFIKGDYDSLIYKKKIDLYGFEVDVLKVGGRSIYYVPDLQKM